MAKTLKEYLKKRLNKRGKDYGVMSITIKKTYAKALKFLAIERDSTVIDQLELILSKDKDFMTKAKDIHEQERNKAWKDKQKRERNKL